MKQIIFIAILLTCAFGACSSDNDGDEQSASVQAPSDITIERMGKTKVLLRWKDNSNNETGFSILLRKADTSENIEIAKVRKCHRIYNRKWSGRRKHILFRSKSILGYEYFTCHLRALSVGSPR